MHIKLSRRFRWLALLALSFLVLMSVIVRPSALLTFAIIAFAGSVSSQRTYAIQ